MISQVWHKFCPSLCWKTKLVRISRPLMQYPLNKSKREPPWENRGTSSEINPCHRTAVTEKTVCPHCLTLPHLVPPAMTFHYYRVTAAKLPCSYQQEGKLVTIMINKTALAQTMLREGSLWRNQMLEVSGMKYQHHPVAPLICFLLFWGQKGPDAARPPQKEERCFFLGVSLSFGWC